MSDNISTIFQKFFTHRTSTLWERFPGVYRALIVETNDPLNMGRVRFKCPDMHNWDLPPEDCPWAVPSLDAGGGRSGSWSAPCIGDWVWIDFERSHPYGPVWTGSAAPTRRKQYPMPAVSQPSPVSLDTQGRPVAAPDDYDINYLPVDGRPMSSGRQDRYGHMDIMSAVGFYPAEHDRLPPPADFDPLQDASFRQARAIPLPNAPDAKYMARVTKYGHVFLLGDQGYAWKKDERAGLGEFTGDTEADEEFEIARWKYIQRLLNGGGVDGDRRQLLLMSRYGHRIEARDTGWAQVGPIPSRSRPGEYGEPTFLSTEDTDDFRWIKIRTKGGWVMQAYDKGFDPQDDEFVQRPLLDEMGASTEMEDRYWADRDARWFRIIGRHGFKFVIDERGSHPSAAHRSETPRGNGVLIKGRRTGGCRSEGPVEGDPRGFYWEFNENDDANHTTWGTPLGQAMEMNDATEYMALVVGLGSDYARPHMGLAENEFLLEPTRARDPEGRAHHLVIDHQNEYIRLKTRSGHGLPARDQVNPSALAVEPDDDNDNLHQGFEARDGSLGDGPWVELVDSQHRGLWLSRGRNLVILRSKLGKKTYVWMDDDNDELVFHNDEEGGKTQILSRGDVEIISEGDITMSATNINLKAREKIRTEAGGNPLTLDGDKMQTGGDINGNVGNVRVGGVPSLDDVTAIARVAAAEMFNEAIANLATAINEAVSSAQVQGTVDVNQQQVQVQSSIGGVNVQFEPVDPGVQAPQTPTGAGNPQPGGEAIEEPEPVEVPETVEPTDRGVAYNRPSVISAAEIEHRVNRV